MKIQVFGTGCPKCKELENRVRAAAAALSIPADIVKVTDVKAIMAAGVMMTPAVGIDGKIVTTGKLPSIPELSSIITTHLAKMEAGG